MNTGCKNCHKRHRADKLIESNPVLLEMCGQRSPDSLSTSEIDKIVAESGIKCPNCNSGPNFAPTKTFNLMFKTNIGATDDDSRL